MRTEDIGVDTLGPDGIVAAAHDLYTSLSFKPPPNQFNILAAFILCSDSNQTCKIISLATGSKCLPGARLPERGDALHDCHAEVLARRGFVRWLLEEIGRAELAGSSPWIEKQLDGRYALRDDIRLQMYVSTVPCGDASTRCLTSSQDPAMAALKDSTAWSVLPPSTPSRGRDNYSLYGVLRTKPGRADSPPTRSMSCSDKIARWNVLGVQGALGARVAKPVYIERVVVGEVEEVAREDLREDCRRAFWGRLKGVKGLPVPYALHRPSIHFTVIPFIHSRSYLGSQGLTACNESLCWVVDTSQSREVLINGLKRGVPPKHRYNAKFRPQLSKLSLFNLYIQTVIALGLIHPQSQTYHATKQSVSEYQTAKKMLLGEGAAFQGWVSSGERWETFDAGGRCILE